MSSKTVMIGGSKVTFALDENEQLVVDYHAQAQVIVDFDLLMTTDQRLKVLEALAHENFYSFAFYAGSYSDELLNRAFKRDDYDNYVFTEESYAFMEFLEEVGLSPEISAMAAMLTDVTGVETFENRKAAFNAFRERGHALKLSAEGEAHNLITFTPFYLLSIISGLGIASRASKTVNDDPQRLLKVTASLGTLDSLAVDETVSDIQLNILVNMPIDNFPQSIKDREGTARAFVQDVIISHEDWASVKSYVSLNDALTHKLHSMLKLSVAPSGQDREPSASERAFIGILRSKYSEESLMKVFDAEDSHPELIRTSPEYLRAFMLLADHVEEGNELTGNFSWIFALDPDLNMDAVYDRYSKESAYVPF